jgi:hypothetical protein
MTRDANPASLAASRAEPVSNIGMAIEIVMRERACDAGAAARTIQARAAEYGLTFGDLATQITNVDQG